MDTQTPIRFSPAFYLCLLIALIPSFGWIVHYDFTSLSTLQIILISLAKIGAFGGLAMFGVSLIIGNKNVWLDKFFGGLDKMYYTHRIFGATSLLLLVLHPISLYLYKLTTTTPEPLSFFIGVESGGVLLGAIALYGMIAVLIISLYSKVRHELFIVVHRFLGVLFVIGSLHAFLSGSIIAEAMWLHYYLLILTIISSLFFVLFTLVTDVFHKPYTYRVHAVYARPHNITELIVEPRSRIMHFTPGQFAYIKLPHKGLGEYHPFTIASGIHDRKLRFIIRSTGDFTRAIADVKAGTKVLAKGPFGGFTFADKHHKNQLWIAGGIGVTPFLSKARSLRHNLAKNSIEMIYATADSPPFGLDELEEIEHKNKGFNVTLFHEDTFGYVKLQTLIEHYKDVHERAIYVCGPPPLLQAVKREAEALGISHQLHYEEFSF